MLEKQENNAHLLLFQDQVNIQKKNNRYFIDDFWWHKPDSIHKKLSRLRFNLPLYTTSERSSVLVAKTVTQNKDTNKYANLFFKTSDFIVQNIFKQPRDCIIYYSNSIGMAKFQSVIEDTEDLCFIHFTPNDQISKPKLKIDQLKALRSCGMSFLKLIDSGCEMPKYMIGVSNTDMTEFAISYGFSIVQDKTRERIVRKSTNSKTTMQRKFYEKWLQIYDDTINTVVYLETNRLKDPEFRQNIAIMVQRTNQILMKKNK